MYTTVTIKTEKQLHRDAKKTAQKLGMPLTTVINAMLRQFVRDETITVSAHPIPRQEKMAAWQKTSARMDAGHSKTFSNVEDLIEHLGLEK